MKDVISAGATFTSSVNFSFTRRKLIEFNSIQLQMNSACFFHRVKGKCYTWCYWFSNSCPIVSAIWIWVVKEYKEHENMSAESTEHSNLTGHFLSTALNFNVQLTSRTATDWLLINHFPLIWFTADVKWTKQLANKVTPADKLRDIRSGE